MQLDEIQAELRRAKLEAERLTMRLGEAQLWQKPPDGGWSVGECLAHLNLVNEPYLAKMRAAAAKTRTKNRTGQGPFKFGRLGGSFVRQLTAEAKGKIGTSKMFEPDAQPDVLARFVRVQDALLDVAEDADGLDLARVGFATPNLPLRLSLFEALNLVVVHEGRHLAQAARVRSRLNAG